MAKLLASSLVVALLFAAASAEIDVKAATEKCQQNLGITDPASLMIENSMNLKDENDEKGRCFVECMVTEFGIYKNGNLDLGVVEQQSKDLQEYAKSQGINVDENTIKNKVQECSKKDGNGKCMKGYQIWKCLENFARTTIGVAR